MKEEKAKLMAKQEEFILTISENGFGKKTSAYEYRITNRGGSGIINMDISKKTGKVVSSGFAKNTDEMILVTNAGKLIRVKLDDVRVTSRATLGVILFKTAKGEKVASVSLISNDQKEIIGEDS